MHAALDCHRAHTLYGYEKQSAVYYSTISLQFCGVAVQCSQKDAGKGSSFNVTYSTLNPSFFMVHCDVNARESFCSSFYKKCIIFSCIGTRVWAFVLFKCREAQSPFFRSLSLALTEVLPGHSHSSVSWVFPGVSFGGNRATHLHQWCIQDAS